MRPAFQDAGREYCPFGTLKGCRFPVRTTSEVETSPQQLGELVNKCRPFQDATESRPREFLDQVLILDSLRKLQRESGQLPCCLECLRVRMVESISRVESLQSETVNEKEDRTETSSKGGNAPY